MGTKISALTEETAPNSTDMMVVVNGGVTQKVQIANVVRAGTAIWARVYHNADQSIPNNTTTALAFNSERADTNTIHDTVTNNSRLTCPVAGVYQISLTAQFAGNPTGRRDFYIHLNGTTLIGVLSVAAATSAISGCVSVSYALAASDYVQALVYQDSGGALNILSGAAYSPEFMMVRLGA